MNLYKLTNLLGDFYVIEADATSAETKLTTMLAVADYGYLFDRKVKHIELIAEEVTEFSEGSPDFCGGKNLIL